MYIGVQAKYPLFWAEFNQLLPSRKWKQILPQWITVLTYGRVVSTNGLVTSAKWLFFEKISMITYWEETGTQSRRPRREE
jgi:hypothetical protein